MPLEIELGQLFPTIIEPEVQLLDFPLLLAHKDQSLQRSKQPALAELLGKDAYEMAGAREGCV